MTLRKVIDKRVKYASFWINELVIKCLCCNSDRHECIICYLINIYFNIGTNNLVMIMNRIDNVKKITLKMMKDLNKNDKYVSVSNKKEKDTNNINNMLNILLAAKESTFCK